MPLPANFHSTDEDVQAAYPESLVTVKCGNKSGDFLGGHWAIDPPSPADYFVRCLCGESGCLKLYTVRQFEIHAGRGASKKWCISLKAIEGGNTKLLGAWIQEKCHAAGHPQENSRVMVYWPGAAGTKWYHGTVKDTDRKGRSLVEYDDGDRELLHFAVERFKLEEGTPPPVPLRRKRVHVQGSVDDTATDSSTDNDNNYTPRQSRRVHTMQTSPRRRLRFNMGRSLAQHTTSASSHQSSGAASAGQGSAHQGTSAAGQPVFNTATHEELVDETPEDNPAMHHDGDETSSSHGASLPTAPLSESESASSEEAAVPRRIATSVPAARPQPAAGLPEPLYPSGHPSSSTSVHVAPAAAPSAAAQIVAASSPARLAAATVHETQPANQFPPELPLFASHSASARGPPAAIGSIQAQPGASGAISTEAAEPTAQPSPEPLAAQGTHTAVPAAGAFVTDPLADAQMSSPDEPPSSPASLRKAVEFVNERLQRKSDMRLITPEQLTGLDDTLCGIADLLKLPKCYIRDLLMDPDGGGLSLKQALFMQAYILRHPMHASKATSPTDASLPASSSDSLSTAVAYVNLKLKQEPITSEQVERLEHSLGGIDDLLDLEKGDIEHVLTEKLFGGGLSDMQALSLQVHIIKLKKTRAMMH